VLRNSGIPNALLAPRHRQVCPDEVARVRWTVEGGVIRAIEPETPPLPRAASGDLGGAWVWPTLTDLHTHLDKTATAPRIPETDSTLLGAVKATTADRRHWQAIEMRAWAEFALKCAWVHGTSALRTHLDSVGPQSAVSWDVLDQLQKDWAGRIALQGGGVDRGQPAVDQHLPARPPSAQHAPMAGLAALASDEGLGHSSRLGQR